MGLMVIDALHVDPVVLLMGAYELHPDDAGAVLHFDNQRVLVAADVEHNSSQRADSVSRLEGMNLNLDIREGRNEFQLAAKRLDVLAESADVHVFATLELRHGRLLHVHRLGYIDLGGLARLAQLVQLHFDEHRLSAGSSTRLVATNQQDGAAARRTR
jgi:hypothetical protein